MQAPDKNERIVGFGLAFVAQLLVILPALSAFLLLQDEGNLLAWASRMIDGQIPYRDFFLRFMPGTPFLLKLAFTVLGEDIWVARAYFAVSLSLLCAVIWLFSRELMPRRWALLPTGLFLCIGGQVWPMIGYHWDATITALLGVYFLSRGVETKWAVLSGVFAGFTVLFLQPRGVAVCLALGVVCLWTSWPDWKRPAALVAGAAVPGCFFVGWLLARGIFSDFWAQAILFNTQNYSAVQGYPFDWGLAVRQGSAVWNGLGNLGEVSFTDWLPWFLRAFSFWFADLVKYIGFLPVLVGGTVAFFFLRPKEPQKTVLGCLLILLWISTYFAWPRATRYHFNFLTPMWYPLLGYLLWRARVKFGKLVLFPTFGIALIFAVHGLDNVTSWNAYKYPVQFVRGKLYMEQRAQAELVQHLSATLARDFEGKALFAFPELPLYVWLTGAHNPTPFEQLTPTYYSDQQIQEVREDLEQANPTGILFASVAQSVRNDYPNMDAEKYMAEEQRVLALLTQGATPLPPIGPYRIYMLP